MLMSDSQRSVQLDEWIRICFFQEKAKKKKKFSNLKPKPSFKKMVFRMKLINIDDYAC